MKNIRYYAIGHSYLLHGAFDGWQTEGVWGMAATKAENDYFHMFQKMLRDGFEAKVEAVAENHADFERCCSADATRDTYLASENYSHMAEVIKSFKPNVITVFVGGGNTIARDEKSLTLFFEVLCEMIKNNKRDDAVVICSAIGTAVEPCKTVALKYGFVYADSSVIHEKAGRENPYYAFADYPEYDEKAAVGAIEFRTHPGDAGHKKIASQFFESAKEEIYRKIPDGAFEEEYEYEKYLTSNKIEKFKVSTTPEFYVGFNGFNIRQNGDAISFSSAPGTGASLSTYGTCISKEYKKFFIEMSVGGADGSEKLTLYIRSASGLREYSQSIPDNAMRRYEFDISDKAETIVGFEVRPEISECCLTVKALGFKE